MGCSRRAALVVGVVCAVLLGVVLVFMSRRRDAGTRTLKTRWTVDEAVGVARSVDTRGQLPAATVLSHAGTTLTLAPDGALTRLKLAGGGEIPVAPARAGYVAIVPLTATGEVAGAALAAAGPQTQVPLQHLAGSAGAVLKSRLPVGGGGLACRVQQHIAATDRGAETNVTVESDAGVPGYAVAFVATAVSGPDSAIPVGIEGTGDVPMEMHVVTDALR